MPETKPKYKNKITSIDSNSNTAITLIALIITIIVLLILAGVTLNMIMGENGIINKAQLAKEKNNEAQEKENENLKSLENSLDEIYRGNRLSEKLINCACDLALKQGFSRMYIMSGEIGLYEKYGFVKMEDEMELVE